MSLWLLPLLLISVLPQSRQANQSLKCLNDYIRNITCIWNSTGMRSDAVCTLHFQESSCNLQPLGSHRKLRSCHLTGMVFGLLTKPDITVKCENSTGPVARFQELAKDNIQLAHPGLPTITEKNISWSRGSPFSEYISSYIFQLEFKLADEPWEVVKPINILNTNTWVELDEDKLHRGAEYQARVRVKTDCRSYCGEWSTWSPIASWISTVGKPEKPTVKPQLVDVKYMIIIPAAAVALFIFLVFFKTQRSSWVHKVKHVPDPSKFFDALNSVHGGNFQKWIRPVFALESFYTAQHSEDISPVEVSKSMNSDTLFKKECDILAEGWDSSGHSSSFSNMGYFTSGCHSSYESESCRVYFSYRKTGAGTSEDSKRPRELDRRPLQTNLSYESLEKLADSCPESTHPDSGFGVESGDEETTDEGKEEDLLKDTSLSNPSASLPVPMLCRLSPFASHLAALPALPLPLPVFDLLTATDGDLTSLEEALCKSSLLKIEPSAGGYMPVAKCSSNKFEHRLHYKKDTDKNHLHDIPSFQLIKE